MYVRCVPRIEEVSASAYGDLFPRFKKLSNFSHLGLSTPLIRALWQLYCALHSSQFSDLSSVHSARPSAQCSVQCRVQCAVQECSRRTEDDECTVGIPGSSSIAWLADHSASQCTVVHHRQCGALFCTVQMYCSALCCSEVQSLNCGGGAAPAR